MKAIYAGSFDCYTNGHHSLVKKAVKVFDELHILVSANSGKVRCFSAERMAAAIEAALQADNISGCTVSICRGLVALYAERHDIPFLIRGLRNTTDYQYEESIASANRLISPSLETIYFRTDNAAISSSTVREMLKYGRDVSSLVPEAVLRCVTGEKVYTALGRADRP